MHPHHNPIPHLHQTSQEARVRAQNKARQREQEKAERMVSDKSRYRQIMRKVRALVRKNHAIYPKDLLGDELKVVVRFLGLEPKPNRRTNKYVNIFLVDACLFARLLAFCLFLHTHSTSYIYIYLYLCFVCRINKPERFRACLQHFLAADEDSSSGNEDAAGAGAVDDDVYDATTDDSTGEEDLDVTLDEDEDEDDVTPDEDEDDDVTPDEDEGAAGTCLLYTSPSPRDRQKSRMPSSA